MWTPPKARISWVGMLCGWLVVGLLVWPTASGAASTTFSGQATVVHATVLGAEIVLADTGPLPPAGGALEASLLEASVPGVLTAEVLHATTIGQKRASRSEASVANVELTVGGHRIAADFLMARAHAHCTGGAPSVSGRSEIAVLVIDGSTITVTGSPNQTIPLPNGQVVLNEQASFVSGSFGEITVNALHVVVFGTADVVISHAHADIDCAGEEPGGDFVTGGGWITGTPTGVPANFGVAGGIRHGDFWGHLNYLDHGSQLHVKSTSVTAYVLVDAETRRIAGTCEINGQGGYTDTVVVADRGEPGRQDTLAVSLSNGYTAGGVLQGGNIQLH